MRRVAMVEVLLLALLGLGSAKASHSFSGKPGRIAFARAGESQSGIFTIRKDGTGLRRLSKRQDTFPSWSPDGSRIAFIRTFERQGVTRIMVMNADGSDRHRVGTSSRGFAEGCAVGNPTWSYDGSWLAYVDDCFDQTPRVAQIRLASPDGSTALDLTDYGSFNHLGLQPWSPNLEESLQLTFTSDRDGDLEVFVMNSDGTGVTQLTDDTVDQFDAAWSPAGTSIAFSTQTEPEPNVAENSIYTISPGGGEPVLVVQGDPHALDAIWSPDGSRLLFNRRTAFGEPTAGIVDADGTDETVLSRYDAVQAAWAPNSMSILFVKNGNVTRVDDEGALIKRLTSSPAFDFGPSWEARPSY
jgi:TolB protein